MPWLLARASIVAGNRPDGQGGQEGEHPEGQNDAESHEDQEGPAAIGAR